MLPIFGSERRRQINLGGASSSTSHSSIIDEAKLRREERILIQKQTNNAIKLQAWWRGMREQRQVKGHLRTKLEDALNRGDLLSLETLRMLVIVGRMQADDTILSNWSEKLVEYGPGAFKHSYNEKSG